MHTVEHYSQPLSTAIYSKRLLAIQSSSPSPHNDLHRKITSRRGLLHHPYFLCISTLDFSTNLDSGWRSILGSGSVSAKFALIFHRISTLLHDICSRAHFLFQGHAQLNKSMVSTYIQPNNVNGCSYSHLSSSAKCISLF